jgi:polyhydroxyalkanoate synthase subunit PhaC
MSKVAPSIKKTERPPEDQRPFSFDRPLHAAAARFTAGISPVALMQAHTDWAQHLLFSPDKQAELAEKAARKWMRYFDYSGRASSDPDCKICIEPLAEVAL